MRQSINPQMQLGEVDISAITFNLKSRVMEKQTDDEVTLPIAQGAKQRFPQVSQVSYDRGFWSKENLETLEELLDRAVLPKKGKWSEQDRQRERHPEFVRAKRKHSAVESDINALEQHGSGPVSGHRYRWLQTLCGSGCIGH